MQCWSNLKNKRRAKPLCSLDMEFFSCWEWVSWPACQSRRVLYVRKWPRGPSLPPLRLPRRYPALPLLSIHGVSLSTSSCPSKNRKNSCPIQLSRWPRRAGSLKSIPPNSWPTLSNPAICVHEYIVSILFLHLPLIPQIFLHYVFSSLPGK